MSTAKILPFPGPELDDAPDPIVCCGDDAAWGMDGDEVVDGQPLACGCKGCISCDSETEPWVNAYDCDCEAS